ncbi:Rv0361 family membrane protein [Mycobacterium sp. NPDC003449]
MTYPPIPPSGPNGPWQQPPQYGTGGQYPDPQQPYDPAQYGAPSPYGAPQQPYGSPQPPYGATQFPYGYGGPQQGYPYPQPNPYPQPQPPGGNRTGLIVGGLVVGLVVLVAIIGLVIAMMLPSGDERAIKQLFEDMGHSTGKVDELKQYFCAQDQQFFIPIDTSALEELGIEVPDIAPENPAETAGGIDDIKVDGNEATAKVTAEGGQYTIYFRKESGDWKVCLSADPSMPVLPGLR